MAAQLDAIQVKSNNAVPVGAASISSSNNPGPEN